MAAHLVGGPPNDWAPGSGRSRAGQFSRAKLSSSSSPSLAGPLLKDNACRWWWSGS